MKRTPLKRKTALSRHGPPGRKTPANRLSTTRKATHTSFPTAHDPAHEGDAKRGPVGKWGMERRVALSRSILIRKHGDLAPPWLAQARLLKSEGATLSQIAREVGVPRSTLGRWLKSTKGCSWCGSDLFAGYGYCSEACRDAASAQVTLACAKCGESFVAKRYEVLRGRTFCSKSCSNRARPSRKARYICHRCGCPVNADDSFCSRCYGLGEQARAEADEWWEKRTRLRLAWRRAAERCSCAVCGSRDRIEGHHVLSQQAIRKVAREQGLVLLAILWDSRNLLSVCQGCHGAHTTRMHPIPFSKLPPAALEFAREHGLEWRLERLYPAT